MLTPQSHTTLSWNSIGASLWSTSALLLRSVQHPIKGSSRLIKTCEAEREINIMFIKFALEQCQVVFYTCAQRYGFFAPGTRKKQIKAGKKLNII